MNDRWARYHRSEQAFRAALAGGGIAAVLLGVIGVGIAQGCGPWISFRDFLQRTFWQQGHYGAANLVETAPRGGGTASYAGFSAQEGPAPLAALRSAYRAIADGEEAKADVLATARQAAAVALAPGALSGASLQEARLLDAKVAMRAAGSEAAGLAEARRKLEAFLAASPDPASASEARGWLARVLYKQGDGVAAMKIYLEELDRPSPVVPSYALGMSIRMTFARYEADILDHPEAFFDTPRHALFIVNALTNPTSQYAWGEEPTPEVKRTQGVRILALLRERRALFTADADSRALLVAMMRVSLYGGDLDAVLADAAKAPKDSPLHQDPEFNWMVASARYLGGDVAGAEAPLRRMLGAPGATSADTKTAAQALVGVCLKTGRPVEALHAALVGASARGGGLDGRRPQWCAECEAQDLPYLLDAVLTDEELSSYLTKYPKPFGDAIRAFGYDGPKLTPPDIVRYTLAVRHARRRDYAAAEEIYTKLGVTTRAERMHALAASRAKAADKALPAADRLRARYDEAVYLADNPDRLFFNNLFWRGYQQLALMPSSGREEDGREWGFTPEERAAVAAADRRLRDEQEERWQAYRLLEGVVHDAGESPLAREAVGRILQVLPKIHSRFGREREIASAIRKWSRWLKDRR